VIDGVVVVVARALVLLDTTVLTVVDVEALPCRVLADVVHPAASARQATAPVRRRRKVPLLAMDA